jgi:hypothetical protein
MRWCGHGLPTGTNLPFVGQLANWPPIASALPLPPVIVDRFSPRAVALLTIFTMADRSFHLRLLLPTFARRRRLTASSLAALIFTVCAAVAPIGASAQPPPQPPPEATEKTAGQDDNPTKVVLWSLRNEYFNLAGDRWRNLLLLRGDEAIFRGKPQLPGRRGLLLRIDIPFAATHFAGATRAGLGNVYVQALSIPRLTRKFGFVAGSGLAMPTNTDSRIGIRKWVAAPIVGPIWFTPQKGFFLIKAQGFLSFAGDDDAPSVRLLRIQPTYMLPLKHRWWIQLDTEATTNFNASGHTGFTSGCRVGKLMTRHLAMWVEPRVGWGRYREADFVLRSSIYWVR